MRVGDVVSCKYDCGVKQKKKWISMH